MAPYTNPYTGATWNNSFSQMLDMTRNWNQNLWQAQQRLQQVTAQTAAMGSAASRLSAPAVIQTTEPQPGAGPHLPYGNGGGGRYPITATDFRALAERLVPSELVNAMPTLTADQRAALRGTYEEWIRGYETFARANNVASGLAYAASQSLRAMRGTGVPEDEINRLIAHFNDALAESAEFVALTPRQKQVMHEHAVITGSNIWYLQMTGLEQNNAAMQSQAQDLAQLVLADFTWNAV